MVINKYLLIMMQYWNYGLLGQPLNWGKWPGPDVAQ